MSRVTMSTVNRGAVMANLRQYQGAARQRAQRVTANSLERLTNRIAAFCPYDRSESDDFHMVEHIYTRLSPDSLSYEAGFSGAEFRENGQPEYFIYTEFGTTLMDAQPCVFPARDEEAPVFERELAEALRPRASDGV